VAVLTSQFEILRGWPDGSAIAEDFSIGGTDTNKHHAGTWVTLDSASPTVMATTDAKPSSSRTGKCYMIIEGREDTSSKLSGTVTCLLGGGYVAKLHNPTAVQVAAGAQVMFAAKAVDDSDYTYAPGVPVCVRAGVIAPAFEAAADAGDIVALNADAYDAADVALINARDSVVGHVVRYDATESVLEVYIR